MAIKKGRDFNFKLFFSHYAFSNVEKASIYNRFSNNRPCIMSHNDGITGFSCSNFNDACKYQGKYAFDLLYISLKRRNSNCLKSTKTQHRWKNRSYICKNCCQKLRLQNFLQFCHYVLLRVASLRNKILSIKPIKGPCEDINLGRMYSGAITYRWSSHRSW